MPGQPFRKAGAQRAARLLRLGGGSGLRWLAGGTRRRRRWSPVLEVGEDELVLERLEPTSPTLRAGRGLRAGAGGDPRGRRTRIREPAGRLARRRLAGTRSASCSPCRSNPVPTLERVLRAPAARGGPRPGPAARHLRRPGGRPLREGRRPGRVRRAGHRRAPVAAARRPLGRQRRLDRTRRGAHRPGRARRPPRGRPRVPRPLRRPAPRRDPRRVCGGRTTRGRLAGAGLRCISCTR